MIRYQFRFSPLRRRDYNTMTRGKRQDDAERSFPTTLANWNNSPQIPGQETTSNPFSSAGQAWQTGSSFT
jgi:hypothetical protein